MIARPNHLRKIAHLFIGRILPQPQGLIRRHAFAALDLRSNLIGQRRHSAHVSSLFPNEHWGLPSF